MVRKGASDELNLEGVLDVFRESEPDVVNTVVGPIGRISCTTISRAVVGSPSVREVGVQKRIRAHFWCGVVVTSSNDEAPWVVCFDLSGECEHILNLQHASVLTVELQMGVHGPECFALKLWWFCADSQHSSFFRAELSVHLVSGLQDREC